MKRELIYDIFKFALSSHEADFGVFKGVSPEQWNWAVISNFVPQISEK